MVKVKAFQGYTLPAELFQKFLSKNIENIPAKKLLFKMGSNSKSQNEYQYDSKKLLIQHPESIFIYQQCFEGKVSQGVITEISVNDYHKGRIKKHEKTLNRKDRDHVTYRNSLINPATLALPEKECQQQDKQLTLDIILENITKNKQNFQQYANWSTEDGRLHTLWILSNRNQRDSWIIKTIIESLNKEKAMYILDGHHRFDAAHKNYIEFLENLESGIASPVKPHQHSSFWIPGFIFPNKHIEVHSQHRLLKSLHPKQHKQDLLRYLYGHDAEVEEIVGSYCLQTLEYISQNGMKVDGQIKKKGHDFIIVSKQKMLGIRLPKQKQDQSKEPIISKFLDDRILMPLFGYNKDNLEKHLTFLPGIQKVEQHVEKIRQTAYGQTQLIEEHFLFLVKPIGWKRLMKIADRNEVLPPKSTWLEPKPCLEMVLRAFTSI